MLRKIYTKHIHVQPCTPTAQTPTHPPTHTKLIKEGVQGLAQGAQGAGIHQSTAPSFSGQPSSHRSQSITQICSWPITNKHAHTHIYEERRGRKMEGEKLKGRERKERGSPLTPISLHSSVHWRSERPLTTVPSICGYVRLQMEHLSPPYSNNTSVTYCRLNGRVTEKWISFVKVISVLTCSTRQHVASCFRSIHPHFGDASKIHKLTTNRFN